MVLAQYSHRPIFVSTLSVIAFMACGDPKPESPSTGAASESRDVASTPQDSSSDTTPPRVEHGWGEMQSIGSRINQFSQEMSVPVLAVNSKGQALVAWTSTHTENDPRHPRLRAAIYRDGAWQPSFEVTPQPAQDPVVAINDRGDMMISYLRLDHDSSQVLSSEERWAVVASQWDWKEPQRVGHAAPSGIEGLYGHEAEIALDAKGNALLAFKQSGIQTGLFVAYYSGGSWGAANRVDHNIPSHVHTFDLAGNEAGQAMLLWLDIQVGKDAKGEDERTLLLKAKAFTAGVWESEQALGPGWKRGAGRAAAPWVEIDHRGNAVSLYIEEDAEKKGSLKAQDYIGQSKRWSDASLLWSSREEGRLARARLAMNSSGDAAAVWTLELPEEKIGARMSYRAREQSQWSESMGFAVHPSTLGVHAQVTVDGEGKAWLGWEQSKVDPERSYHTRAYLPNAGWEAAERPLGGTDFLLRASADAKVFAVSRRTVIGQEPLGYYSVPTASVYTPK